MACSGSGTSLYYAWFDNPMSSQVERIVALCALLSGSAGQRSATVGHKLKAFAQSGRPVLVIEMSCPNLLRSLRAIPEKLWIPARQGFKMPHYRGCGDKRAACLARNPRRLYPLETNRLVVDNEKSHSGVLFTHL